MNYQQSDQRQDAAHPRSLPLRAILTVVDGDCAGHRKAIFPNQSLEVGRSSLVDFSFPDDLMMSSLHFRIQNQGRVLLVDLGSTNGTFVNGQRVRQVELRSGVEIFAGQTRFAVNISVLEIPTQPLPQPPPHQQHPPQHPAQPVQPTGPAVQSLSNHALDPENALDNGVLDDGPAPATSIWSAKDKQRAFQQMTPPPPSPPPPATAPTAAPMPPAAANPSIHADAWPPTGPGQYGSHPSAPPQPHSVQPRSVQPHSVQPHSVPVQPSSFQPNSVLPTASPMPAAVDVPLAPHTSAGRVKGLLLRVDSGEESSVRPRVWLLPGQRLIVGRTERADFSVPWDAGLSERHFLVECRPEQCTVYNLHDGNTTYVNGQPIARARLYHGDQLAAGVTTFVVELEGDASVTRAPSDAGTVQADEQVSSMTVPSRVDCLASVCSTTKLTRFTGDAEQTTPAAVVSSLARAYAGFLLVDFQRICELVPEQLTADDCVTGVGSGLGPRYLIGGSDGLPMLTLLEEHWESDAVVCLFSKLQKPELIEHLRSVIQNDEMLGICWPGILRSMLESGNRKTIKQLFQQIDAVLVESDEPGQWMIYAHDETAKRLPDLNFVFDAPA